MKINYDDKRIDYMGRIDTREDGTHFYFAASCAVVHFNGTEISVEICSNTIWGSNSLGYIIDGRIGKVPLNPSNDGKFVTYQLANALEPYKEHKLTIYKRHDSCQALVLKSISTDGMILPFKNEEGLKLEFYGDSVTSGACTEAEGFEGRCDPPSADNAYDNAWYSYSVQTAEILGARVHNVAQGGIAVFDGTGYFHAPGTIGMESVYDKMCYFPEAGEITKWNFSRYKPDIVVFALGQNDKHNDATNLDDIDIYDPNTVRKWVAGYKKIVRSVNSHYGAGTKYIFLLTLIVHCSAWDQAVETLVDELKSEGLNAYHLILKCGGISTPGHPRKSEQRKMAEELSAFIKCII